MGTDMAQTDDTDDTFFETHKNPSLFLLYLCYQEIVLLSVVNTTKSKVNLYFFIYFFGVI